MQVAQPGQKQASDASVLARKARAAHSADSIAQMIFFICAVLLVVVIAGIFIFIGSNAFRVFFEPHGTSVLHFFTGTVWDPVGNPDFNKLPNFGAAGLILGSVVITLVSVLIVTPLAFGMALFITEVAPAWLANVLRPLLEIFTGMPSVIIGFLGLIVIVPFVQRVTAPLTGNLPTGGFGWGTAIIVLTLMIIPTVISVSVDALRAVPNSVREASLALGSTRWQMMIRAIIPAAAPTLGTAVILGLTRAIGETLAVSMVLGNTQLPAQLFNLQALFQPNVNITGSIVLNFAETEGVSRDAYWTLAFVLLTISFLFICVSRYLASRSVYK